MLRASVLMIAANVCQAQPCKGKHCAVVGDISGLIQQTQTVSELDHDSADDSVDSAWSFEDSALGHLVDKLDPEAVTEQINQVIEDNKLSLESAQNRLYGLANKFGSRLNETMVAAQQRVDSLQEIFKKGRAVKDQAILEAVSMITSMGDAAVDVAQKVSGEVEQGKFKVKQMMTLLHSEKVESRREEVRQSLDGAMSTLTGLMHTLEDAMGMHSDADLPHSLIEVSDKAVSNISQPDLSATIDATIDATIKRADDMLHHADNLLDNAKVYITFVQTRVDSLRTETVELAEAVGNKSDAAFDLGNAVAEDVIKKLSEVDGMLTGKISIVEANNIMLAKHSSALPVALSLGVCAFVVAIVSAFAFGIRS